MRAIHYLSVLAIASVFAGCSKGDTGPQGPAGANGVANINSQQYSVNSSDWSAASPYTTWTSTWTESDIQDPDNDAVEAYWSTASSGWLALPVTSLITTGDEMSFGYDNGIVTFSYYTGGSLTEPPSYYNGTGGYPDLTTIYFKVTVIPPSIQVKYPGVNWKNAAEVAQLPEMKAILKKP